jgi:hypothetical protein
MIQMNRKKNHSIDQKMSMNETSATIMASSLSLVFCDQGNGHYNQRAAWASSLVGCAWVQQDLNRRPAPAAIAGGSPCATGVHLPDGIEASAVVELVVQVDGGVDQ